jgi:hypothetical protein
MPGGLSVVGKEFQVLVARIKKGAMVGSCFAFARTEGDLVLHIR